MAGFLTKVSDFLTGGAGTKILDKVLDQFPDKLSEEERLKLENAVLKATRDHEIRLLEIANEQEAEFSSRLKEMEGTAADLQRFGILGSVIVFLRGLQRPLWGYSVLVLDFMVFSGQWKLADLVQEVGDNVIGANIESAFWVINLLVLGFLFGERAMRNVLPLIKGIRTNQVT